MKRMTILWLILSFLLLFWPRTCFAAENKFGIHILEPADVDKAAELVNSSGGDWGYITIVIRDDDLNFAKWQGFMDQCREKHLIPLVRVATHLEEKNWVKPKIEEATKWAEFLNALNWPIEDQYVILFNEPNQAKEWGGEVNPKEYARILSEFNLKFKIQNSKFKVLNAGLDLAAGNTKTTMDAFKFMQEMNWEVPGIFEQLDGWASHSYPNHGYLGKPWETGKTSIRGYDWELTVLKNNFKIAKDLPVFITETGWPKSQLTANSYQLSAKKRTTPRYYDEKTVANYFKQAYEDVWLKDSRVKAITPFLLNYNQDLFAEFSWLDLKGDPYLQYETVKCLAKPSWWPEQIEKFSFKRLDLPPFLITNSTYQGKILLLNEGQSILGEKNDFILKKTGSDAQIQVSDLIPESKFIRPKQSSWLNFEIKTGSQAGEFKFTWEGIGENKIIVVQPSLITTATLTLWEKIFSKLKFW